MPRQVTTGGEFPSTDQLTGIGELCFLFFRAPNARTTAVSGLRHSIEPAIDTGHFAVMRQDGVPRAAMTWAFLNAESEARFLNQGILSSQDWISGDRLWLMDMIAPYGQGSAARMLAFWHDSLKPEVREYRFIRPGRRMGETRRYLARRLPNGKFGWQMMVHTQDPT